jgi:hypothetical protein
MKTNKNLLSIQILKSWKFTKANTKFGQSFRTARNLGSASAQVEKHRSKCLMALPAVARLKFILSNVCVIIEYNSVRQ